MDSQLISRVFLLRNGPKNASSTRTKSLLSCMELSPSVHIGVSFAGSVRSRIQLLRFPGIMHVNLLVEKKAQSWSFVLSFEFFCQQSKTLNMRNKNLRELRDTNLGMMKIAG